MLEYDAGNNDTHSTNEIDSLFDRNVEHARCVDAVGYSDHTNAIGPGIHIHPPQNRHRSTRRREGHEGIRYRTGSIPEHSASIGHRPSPLAEDRAGRHRMYDVQ